ncbi:hypothetical protein AURDEDRAFT_176201 [Auricularia subglabra TFB-10046 SS5]|nr:hypothetical protein AURDEDRAFT_176201 [Auricularia subglabra TFB-10046 SS5]
MTTPDVPELIVAPATQIAGPVKPQKQAKKQLAGKQALRSDYDPTDATPVPAESREQVAKRLLDEALQRIYDLPDLGDDEILALVHEGTSRQVYRLLYHYQQVEAQAEQLASSLLEAENRVQDLHDELTRAKKALKRVRKQRDELKEKVDEGDEGVL